MEGVEVKRGTIIDCKYCNHPPKLLKHPFFRMYVITCRNSECLNRPDTFFTMSKREVINTWNRKMGGIA
jgi:hypothetical protein